MVLVTRDQNLKAKARRHGLTTDGPPPPQQEFKPRRPRKPSPEVVLGHPGGQVSKTPLNELVEGEHSRLVAVRPRYLIENKGANGVSDVTTGVRTRDGRTHRFESYRAPLLGAGETSVVDNVGSIPPDFLDGVHESAAFDGSFSGPSSETARPRAGRSSTTQRAARLAGAKSPEAARARLRRKTWPLLQAAKTRGREYVRMITLEYTAPGNRAGGTESCRR